MCHHRVAFGVRRSAFGVRRSVGSGFWFVPRSERAWTDRNSEIGRLILARRLSYIKFPNVLAVSARTCLSAASSTRHRSGPHGRTQKIQISVPSASLWLIQSSVSSSVPLRTPPPTRRHRIHLVAATAALCLRGESPSSFLLFNSAFHPCLRGELLVGNGKAYSKNGFRRRRIGLSRARGIQWFPGNVGRPDSRRAASMPKRS